MNITILTLTIQDMKMTALKKKKTAVVVYNRHKKSAEIIPQIGSQLLPST
jgi:hypothetical protein